MTPLEEVREKLVKVDIAICGMEKAREELLSAFAILERIITEERAEPAKPEPGEDEILALRVEAESEYDDYRGNPQDYADICPKYGQGDTALQARAFIDGYMCAAEVKRRIEEAGR